MKAISYSQTGDARDVLKVSEMEDVAAQPIELRSINFASVNGQCQQPAFRRKAQNARSFVPGEAPGNAPGSRGQADTGYVISRNDLHGSVVSHDLIRPVLGTPRQCERDNSCRLL